MEYDPSNWYWIVNGSTTQVYSSKAGDYVPVANATYVAWRAAGGVAKPGAGEWYITARRRGSR